MCPTRAGWLNPLTAYIALHCSDQVPRFSHRSVLNMSEALQRMGLDELFSSEHADLRGLNGVANDLHLSDVVQVRASTQ